MAEIQRGMEGVKVESRGIGATRQQAVDHKLREEASGQVALAVMLPGMVALKGGNLGIGAKRQQVEDHKVRSEVSGLAAEKSR
jgi:ABC-type antimicrobial peptide transport system ATPase subunit